MEKLFYSKQEVRARLGVGRTRYAQMIDAGVLPPPITLTDTARPVHTAEQIRIAENNLLKRLTDNLPRTRKSKPLSNKLRAEIK